MEEKSKNKRIVSRMPVLPSMPVKKRVAAYARVSMEKEAMLHSLAAQVGYYSDLIRRNSEEAADLLIKAVKGKQAAVPAVAC